MRAIGQSGRCAEMDAPAYETTRGDIEALMPRMEASTETMLAHQRELRRLEPGGAEWCARKARMERDGDEALALVGQFAELDNRFQVRKGVINLNYTSQQRQAFTRALRVMVNLAAQVGAVAAHSPRWATTYRWAVRWPRWGCISSGRLRRTSAASRTIR